MVIRFAVALTYFFISLLLPSFCYPQSKGEVLYLKREQAFSRIVAYSVEKKQEFDLVDLNGRTAAAAAYSPDGRSIAFVTIEEGRELYAGVPVYVSYLWILSRDDGNIRKLAGLKDWDYSGFGRILWSGDSKNILVEYGKGVNDYATFKKLGHFGDTGIVVTGSFDLNGNVQRYEEKEKAPVARSVPQVILNTPSYDGVWEASLSSRLPWYDDIPFSQAPPETSLVVKNLQTGKSRVRFSFAGVAQFTRIGIDPHSNYFVMSSSADHKVRKIPVRGEVSVICQLPDAADFQDYSESPTAYLGKVRVVLPAHSQ